MPCRRIRALAAGSLAAVTMTLVAAPAPSHAKPVVARDASVIVEWNRITERTLIENAQPVPTSMLFYGFTALAMYDAVVTIEGRYQPWTKLPRAHAHASPEAAAATAAYLVLRHYFPNSAAALTADYRAALAEIRNGAGKVHGIRVGAQAAAALLVRRVGDGLNATRAEPQGEPPFDPGEWRRTPPGFVPMVGTWLGFVRPMLLPSPTFIPLNGPPALTSAQYATDFAEVRDYGGAVSLRSQEQTDTALFHTVAPRVQHIEAIRAQITGRRLDIVDSARALAVFSTSLADVSVACWRAKYDFKYWRPVTAIALADTDDNPATDVVPGWAPLRDTPPYPEYTSGHACFTGAVSGSLDNLFGAGTLSPAYTMPSYVAGVPDRSYTTTDALDTETMNARIWNGFHFRSAMIDGNALGHAVADFAFANYFRRTR